MDEPRECPEALLTEQWRMRWATESDRLGVRPGTFSQMAPSGLDRGNCRTVLSVTTAVPTASDTGRTGTSRGRQNTHGVKNVKLSSALRLVLVTTLAGGGVAALPATTAQAAVV